MKRKIFCGLLAAGLLAFPGTASAAENAAGNGLFLPVAETDAPLPLVLPFVLGLGVNECLSFVRDFAAEQTAKAEAERAEKTSLHRNGISITTQKRVSQSIWKKS